jgi:hypothetical protein
MAAAKKENVAMPEELAMRIAEHSDRNVRRALLAAEACRVQQYVLDAMLKCWGCAYNNGMLVRLAGIP